MLYPLRLELLAGLDWFAETDCICNTRLASPSELSLVGDETIPTSHFVFTICAWAGKDAGLKLIIAAGPELAMDMDDERHASEIFYLLPGRLMTVKNWFAFISKNGPLTAINFQDITEGQGAGEGEQVCG